MPHLSLNTPFGDITLFEEDEALVAIEWGRVAEQSVSPLLREAKGQLDAYFDGARRAFHLPLSPRGTAFQRAVWDLMSLIPYGAIRTYGEIAAELGSAPRAVGGACARNPIPIVIPCHRVVGAGGRMTGYTGGAGLHTKAALLRLEGAVWRDRKGDDR